MAHDSSSSSPAGSAHADALVEKRHSAGSHGESSHPAMPEEEESATRGMLRDAIQKVMDQIAYHEREAKKHMQHAGELRKDLRESFAFLQDRKSESKPAEKTADAAARKTKDAATEDKPAKTGAKKKSATAKGK